MAIIFQIIGFHNCNGCSRKVRTALHKIGVELVKFDPECGNVTISTTQQAEVIRCALERQLKKKVVILSNDIVSANQNPNSTVSHQPPANRSLDLQEVGQVVLRLSEVLDGVEVTRSNTIRVNFNHRQNPRPEHRGNIGVHIRDENVEYAVQRPPRSPPWAATEPSAQPISAVYGYPAELYRNHDHPNGCCIIL